MPAPAGMLDLLEDCDALLDEAAVHPLDQVRWTPPQMAFLHCRSKFVLLRTGNQFGKTWAGCAELIYRCLGCHPHKPVRKAPIEAWVICKSWSQSIAIQQKLWSLLPKDELMNTSFSSKNGFAGVQKAVAFRNGSIIRIKTIGQDTLDLESATIHYVWIDEPLGDEETFSALQMRLRRTSGDIAITMTPATTGDLTWLRKLVESGQVTDLHFRMESANFIIGTTVLRTEPTPEAPDGEEMNAAWCEKEIATTLSWARGVRCHGEWEYSVTGRAFEAFHRNVHVARNLLTSGLLPEKVELAAGFDFGEDALRTCGVHIYIDMQSRHPRLFVMSEYAPDHGTTIEMDGDGAIEMLARTGDAWHDLDYAWADKKYEGRTTKKSARTLETIIMRKLGKPLLQPPIQVAKRGLKRDHFWPSVRWLHDAMLRPGHFYVDASCTWLITSLEKWDGSDKHEGKDIIDALRYACRHLWGGRMDAPSRVLRRQF